VGLRQTERDPAYIVPTAHQLTVAALSVLKGRSIAASICRRSVTDAHDLYGLPLDRFVAERGALAKKLRADGDRELAASVAGRRKPSVAAWAVNQLVRTQRRALAALFDAGDAIVRAQSELLAGRGDAAALREAVERERAAVTELTAASRGLLSSEGHELTQATLDRVSATLHAAALDEDARAEMREGCLQRELRHVGLGATGAVIDRPDPRPRRNAGRQAQAARAEELKAAQRAEAAAGRTAQRAQRELEAAQTRRDRAAAAWQDAENALAGARERAEAAALVHRRAQQSLDGVRSGQ
jgi:hypothetical protein